MLLWRQATKIVPPWKSCYQRIKCPRVICTSFSAFLGPGSSSYCQSKIVPWQIEIGIDLPKTLGTQAVFTIRSSPSRINTQVYFDLQICLGFDGNQLPAGCKNKTKKSYLPLFLFFSFFFFFCFFFTEWKFPATLPLSSFISVFEQSILIKSLPLHGYIGRRWKKEIFKRRERLELNIGNGNLRKETNGEFFLFNFKLQKFKMACGWNGAPIDCSWFNKLLSRINLWST